MNSTAQATLELINRLAKKTPVLSSKSAKRDPRSVKEYSFLLSLAEKIAPDSIVKPVHKNDPERIFNNKPTICFLQHNDSTSWMPLIPVFCKEVLAQIERFNVDLYPSIFFHKIVHSLPLAKEIAASVGGNSVSSYKEAIELLSSDEPYLLATCPEGSNCLFQYESSIAEFQQFALIKAALATHANVMVMTFNQKRKLSYSVKVPYIGLMKKNAIGIRIPFYWMPQNPLNIRYEVFEKPATPEQFNSLTREQQNELIQLMGRQLKQLMEMRNNQIERGEI